MDAVVRELWREEKTRLWMLNAVISYIRKEDDDQTAQEGNETR